jgi:DNA-directed RNA polymerase specialized sigma24 family protein
MGKLVREDVYRLPLDHPIRISLYDVEKAAEQIRNKEYQYIFNALLNQETKAEIAEEMDCSEKTVHRKIGKIAKMLERILNETGLGRSYGAHK